MAKVARSFLIFVLSLLVALGGFPKPTHAEDEWVITPGRSWGPFTLGMNEDDALRVPGVQFQRSDAFAPAFHLFSLSRGILQFIQNNQTYTLWEIDITDRTSATPESVRVGASLTAVMHAYGDVTDNYITMVQPTRSCLFVTLTADRPRDAPQPNYANLGMTLQYLSQGIWFEFSPITESAAATLKVKRITVVQPRVCPEITS